MRIDRKSRNKIIIVSISVMVFIFAISGVIPNKLLGKNIKAKAGTDKDEISENTPREIELDNSGYLPLDKDPNADDAKMVSANLQGLSKREKQFPVREDGKKVVYLTFDDGPSTVITPKILDVLDEHNVKGTFFVLGNSLVDNTKAQEVLKRIASTGHAIANHSYSHNYKTLYPNGKINVDNFMNDIEKSNEEFKEILGKDFHTETIRFPGGYWTWEGREGIKPVLDEKDYHIMEWNVLAKDAEGAPKKADEMLKIIEDRMKELGANADHIVLLMHDINSKEETVKALPLIIEYYKSLGFEFRTMK